MNPDEDFDKKFVEIWLQAVREGRQAKWVAEQLQVNSGYVINKAQTLRKHGVKLPSIRTGRYSITPDHVAELNKIVEEK